MQHIELHVINDENDAEKAESAGLTEFQATEVCENCQELIAYTQDGFYPCVIVLSVSPQDDDIEFLLCDDCVAPVLMPGFIS